MPEGPETHRAADRIRRALQYEVAADVFFGLSHLEPLAQGLVGQRVMSVTAYGKAMLTEFEDGRAVFSHNQLYGRWYVVRSGTRPSTRRSLRFMVETEAKAALLYSASTIEVLSPEDRQHHPFLCRLGPDPLHDDVTVDSIRAQLARFSRRSLGALLLDQSFVAGLGNYLRSEILFEARVPPERRPGDLTCAETKRLAKAVVVMTRRAYETGGITNSPAQVARLKARGQPRRAYRHWVFARGGQPCRKCGSRITQRPVAGRRLYQCPKCQPGASDV